MPYKLSILGFEYLTGFICVIAAILQSIQLLYNFNLRETIWKKHEKLLEGDMPTPAVIFCSNPPNLNTDQEVVTHGLSHNHDYWANKAPIVTFQTFLKVRIEEVLHFFSDSIQNCPHAREPAA